MIFLRRAWIVFLAILILAAALGCRSGMSKKEEDALVDQAAHLIISAHEHIDRTREGAMILMRVVQAGKKNAMAYALLSKTAIDMGYTSGDDVDPKAIALAKMFLDQALALRPKKPDVLTELFFDALNTKNAPLARAIAEKLTSVPERDGRSYAVEATLAQQEERCPEAIDAAEKALGMEPNGRWARVATRALMRCHDKLKNYVLEEQDYLRDIEVTADSAWPKLNYAAFLLRRHERVDTAIEYAQAAIDQSDVGMAHHILSNAYRIKAVQLKDWGRLEEAGKYFWKAGEAEPTRGCAYYEYGDLFRQMYRQTRQKEQYEEARKGFQMAVKAEPDNADYKAAGAIAAPDEMLKD